MPVRHVALVVYPEFMSLDLFGPLEVFNIANRIEEHASAKHRYEVQVVSTKGGPIPTESGVMVETRKLPSPTSISMALVVGGDGVEKARFDADLLSWFRSAFTTARRVGSICSGAFVLAEAGLIDGRRVTTHWARASQLAREYHDVCVDSDPIYLTDGKVWTSAGVTAGMDLALAMVEEDLGPEVSQLIARWLVMHRHRPGGQSQYATPAWTPKAEQPALRALQLQIEKEPAMDCRLSTLAALVSMSERHFCRVFVEQVGVTPARFVEHVRLDAAREKLESSAVNLDVIAETCGFGTTETLRRTFLRRLGVAPTQYRQTFHIKTQGAPHE